MQNLLFKQKIPNVVVFCYPFFVSGTSNFVKKKDILQDERNYMQKYMPIIYSP